MPKKIYLDYAATTPVDKEVLKAMLPYFSDKFGNAMSVHSFGQEARKAVDKAREKAADFFNCQPNEIIFTSGATESNNLAIKGILRAYYSKFKAKPHIITTAFEHHCVLDTCKILEKEETAEITYLPVYKNGVVKISDIKKAIRPNSILISVMYVNNEIGTVQPVAEIGKLLKQIRNKRKQNYKAPALNHYPFFHTDATQAVSYFDCDVKKLGVDLMSMSAHKIYGPKGAGVLCVHKDTPIKRIQDGGDQEYKLRAGTHNVPGIVGLGAAIDQLTTRNSQFAAKNILKLRNYLIKRVLKEIHGSYLNGDLKRRSPNNANFRFNNVEGEGMVLSLDMEGIASSTGSACSSGALQPSHVLLALGLKPEQAHGSLRLTLGKYTTKKDIDTAINKIKKIIERLRRVSGNILKDYYSKK